jgi:hypothetical protein
LRIAQRLNLPISRIDELSMEEILDERDMIMYLHDLDNPPQPPPKTPENVLKAASRAMTGG